MLSTSARSEFGDTFQEKTTHKNSLGTATAFSKQFTTKKPFVKTEHNKKRNISPISWNNVNKLCQRNQDNKIEKKNEDKKFELLSKFTETLTTTPSTLYPDITRQQNSHHSTPKHKLGVEFNGSLKMV